MKNRKWLNGAFALTLSLSLLAGCGSNSSSNTGAESSSQPSGADKKVTLRWMAFNPENKQLLDKFNKENPNITIQYEQVESANFNTTALSRLAAKADLDIVTLRANQNEFGVAAKTNALMDIGGSAFLDNLNSVSIENGQYNGKQLGYTFGQYAIGAFYNKDLFKANGITTLPTNYEEFLAVCEKLKAGGVAPLVASLKDGWTLLYYFNPQGSMLEANKPGTFDKLSKGEAKWADAGYSELFSIPLELAKKGYLLEGTGGAGYDQGVQAFQSKQAAMWLMGSWALDKFPNDFKDFEVGVFPIPFNKKGEELKVPIVSDNVLSGIEWTKHPNEVKKFLEFMAQPENAKIVSMEQKIFSTVKDGTVDFHPMAPLWNPLFKLGVPDMVTKLTPGVYNELSSQLQMLLLGEGQPSDSAQALQKAQDTDNKTK
ncbi:ABC transporter substrate-binding protein [Paenibacillus wynnii]|uniref:ABC transporter substrate-binding protein n=1 Tax=Paenibacillus wynnii TaxID=268407 RepID=A0A098MB70_9BACL|nr:extracellular solute-binding protein [Paenibacillus wynnii]KGE18797.1 hypothetical protein PWYN_05000 [Paenibacillus wynnii]